jgi:hypothetical protein
MEGMLTSSVKPRLTQIPGVMWEVASLSKRGQPRKGTAGSGCPCRAGDQPESGIPGLPHPALHGRDFDRISSLGLVGLGKDAAVTASTDRITLSMPRPRRQDTTPFNRDLAPTLSYQRQRLGRSTQRSPVARMDWRSRHPTRGRSTELSFSIPRHNNGGAEGRSAGGAPSESGGRQSREGPVYYLPRALSPK